MCIYGKSRVDIILANFKHCKNENGNCLNGERLSFEKVKLNEMPSLLNNQMN